MKKKNFTVNSVTIQLCHCQECNILTESGKLSQSCNNWERTNCEAIICKTIPELVLQATADKRSYERPLFVDSLDCFLNCRERQWKPHTLGMLM